jgi:uncharacterized spore protein YtfJ
MSVSEILRNIGETFQSTASVKNVFGEPVSAGERTIIPVARIAYGFGGGGGGLADNPGGGGGGRVSAVPAGVIEVSPQGTRFIPIPDWRKAAAFGLIAFALGSLLGSRRK